MSEDELELRILERFVARFDEVELADPERQNKCAASSTCGTSFAI
jgi:hypothetical protein